MPSKSKKQAKLMRAVAHGWKPNRIKGPTQAVAKEFVSADERRNKVTGYQFGGMAGMGRGAGRMMQNYRGVPPQRGGLSAGRPGMFGSSWGARSPGGSPPGGDRAGALRQMMQRMQQGQAGGPGQGPGPGPGGGAFPGRIMEMIQQQRGQAPGGGYNPGGGNTGPILSPYEQAEGRMRGLEGGPEGGPGGGVMGPGQGPPGLYDPQDMLMGEGPGGRLEMEGRARQAKMQQMQQRGGPRGMMAGRMNQAQNRFGALTQGAPGGGSFGKPRPGPGSRIAPPPNRYPGGGNPNLGGRNPMLRGRGRFGGRGGRGGRGMLR